MEKDLHQIQVEEIVVAITVVEIHPVPQLALLLNQNLFVHLILSYMEELVAQVHRHML